MVTDSLNRVARALTTLAPQIVSESLNPGATASQLAALVTALGQPLPADYQDLYRCYNGLNEDADNFGSFWYGFGFLPLAEVLAGLPQPTSADVPLRTVHAPVQAGSARRAGWLRLGFDGAHAWLCLDLAASGSHGQVILVDEEYETAFRVADSVAALLADFACDLEQGRYSLDPDALADGDEYLRPDPSIDLANWPTAARWQAYHPR